jgi:hypothetical protein
LAQWKGAQITRNDDEMAGIFAITMENLQKLDTRSLPTWNSEGLEESTNGELAIVTFDSHPTDAAISCCHNIEAR